MNRLAQIIGPAPSELDHQQLLEHLRDIRRSVVFPEPKLPKLKNAAAAKKAKLLKEAFADYGIDISQIDLTTLKKPEA